MYFDIEELRVYDINKESKPEICRKYEGYGKGRIVVVDAPEKAAKGMQ